LKQSSDIGEEEEDINTILHEMERLSHYRGNMGTCVSLHLGWKYVERISRSTSTIKTDWMIARQRKKKE
jgi:hypothetical protein